ncbi:hypothetical protein DMT42_16225 [Streptomyces actuosus]|uniref:Tat pathway signal sequence domain protein n=2 Tax=Streptomyces TaxID=1883 RepID=A0A2U9P213_STRAS|nr:hypothetical protein DMT42_16225 [Streptomyces actuosus]
MCIAMTRRSTLRRLSLLAASAAVITGGALLPGTALAATGAPPSAVAVQANGLRTEAGQWQVTTDKPSGVSVQLPGKPETVQFTRATDGVDGRAYFAQTDYGVLALTVYDGAAGADDLRPMLDSYLKDASQKASTNVTTTASEESTVEGLPALDAQLAGEDGNVGYVRFIAAGQFMIQLETVGPQDKLDAMTEAYMQFLGSMQLPGTGAGPTTDSGGAEPF